MTRADHFPCSFPKYSPGVWGAEHPRRPSRLAAGQRRDNRLAPQALNFPPAANGKPDLSAPGPTPASIAFPRLCGEGLGMGGSRQTEAPR